MGSKVERGFKFELLFGLGLLPFEKPLRFLVFLQGDVMYDAMTESRARNSCEVSTIPASGVNGHRPGSSVHSTQIDHLQHCPPWNFQGPPCGEMYPVHSPACPVFSGVCWPPCPHRAPRATRRAHSLATIVWMSSTKCVLDGRQDNKVCHKIVFF